MIYRMCLLLNTRRLAGGTFFIVPGSNEAPLETWDYVWSCQALGVPRLDGSRFIALSPEFPFSVCMSPSAPSTARSPSTGIAAFPAETILFAVETQLMKRLGYDRPTLRIAHGFSLSSASASSKNFAHFSSRENLMQCFFPSSLVMRNRVLSAQVRRVRRFKA